MVSLWDASCLPGHEEVFVLLWELSLCKQLIATSSTERRDICIIPGLWDSRVILSVSWYQLSMLIFCSSLLLLQESDSMPAPNPRKT